MIKYSPDNKAWLVLITSGCPEGEDRAEPRVKMTKQGA